MSHSKRKVRFHVQQSLSEMALTQNLGGIGRHSRLDSDEENDEDLGELRDDPVTEVAPVTEMAAPTSEMRAMTDNSPITEVDENSSTLSKKLRSEKQPSQPEELNLFS